MVDEKWYYLLHPKVVTLITTLSEEGKINAAPFAWITPLSDSPPLLLVAAWYESHTFQNIAKTKEFVINIVPANLKKEVEVCAEPFPAGVNELEKAKLNSTPAKTVKPPRISECVAWIECVVKKIVEKKDEYSFIIAKVKHVEVKREYYKNFLPRRSILLHMGGKNYSVIKV